MATKKPTRRTKVNPLTRGKGRKVGLHRKAGTTPPAPGGYRWGPGPQDVTPGFSDAQSRGGARDGGTVSHRVGGIPQADAGKRRPPPSGGARGTGISVGRFKGGTPTALPPGTKDTRPKAIGAGSTMGKGSIPQADGGKRRPPPSTARGTTSSARSYGGGGTLPAGTINTRPVAGRTATRRRLGKP